MLDTRSKHRALSANRLAALMAGVVVVLRGAGTALIGNADGGDTGTPASAGSAAPAPSTARTGTGDPSVNQTYRRDWAGVVDIRVTTTTMSPGPLGLPMTQEAQAEGTGVVYDESGGTAPCAEGQNAGIGFATPSNMVANVAHRIIAGRPVAHAYLGVWLNAASAGGAEVASVQSTSPAATLGLKPWGRITAVNGKPAKSAQQFVETLDSYSRGQTVRLTVKRGGSKLAIRVKLGTRPRTVSGD